MQSCLGSSRNALLSSIGWRERKKFAKIFLACDQALISAFGHERFLRPREHTRPLGTRASERFVRGLVLVISARSLTNLSSTWQRILYIGAPGVGRKGTNMARNQGDKMEGKSETNQGKTVKNKIKREKRRKQNAKSNN